MLMKCSSFFSWYTEVIVHFSTFFPELKEKEALIVDILEDEERYVIKVPYVWH